MSDTAPTQRRTPALIGGNKGGVNNYIKTGGGGVPRHLYVLLEVLLGGGGVNPLSFYKLEIVSPRIHNTLLLFDPNGNMQISTIMQRPPRIVIGHCPISLRVIL